MASAALMMAHQVAGKATRDSVFLSAFPASELPKTVIAAAFTALVLTLLFSRSLAWFGPRRVVPAGFLLSALLHLVEWRLLYTAPKFAAVMTYLHIVGFGAVLLSGFWSIVNESFDPQSAKRAFGRITGAGTLGGIGGGLLTERISTMLPAQSILLLLVGFHVLCAFAILLFPPGGDPLANRKPSQEPLSPAEVFRRAPYLRSLAVLVLLGTTSAAMIDFIFKSEAAGAIEKGAPLLRFFAIFYTSTQVVTFLVQTLITRVSLEKFGLSRTVGSLPMGVATFSGLGLLFPAFPVYAVARGFEYVMRGSLFRSGYELLYTPIAPEEKRVAKTIIDVGCDRAGDALGAGIVQALLFAGAVFYKSELLGLTFGCAVVSLYIANRLDRVYTSVIEKRLVDHALALNMEDIQDSTTMSAVLRTMPAQRARSGDTSVPPGLAPYRAEARTVPILDDPSLQRLIELRSGMAPRVIAALEQDRPLDLIEMPQVIRLLAWDEVAEAAGAVLARVGPRITGMLVDHLIDESQDFAVRRRIPRYLARQGTQRAFDGLLGGLESSRFEVRFQCARALDYMSRKNDGLKASQDLIMHAVERELSYAPAALAARKLLDTPDPDMDLAYLDDEVRERADKNLELVFSLLATILPREPLQVAFRAFHSGDRYLKGLSIEYLEAQLPPHSLDNFRRMAEVGFEKSPVSRSRDEIMRELMALRKAGTTADED